MKNQGILAEYKRISDEELIYRFVHRQDHLAMNALFERYGHLVFGVCMKYLKDPENAKDATQQIFIKLLSDLPRFQIEKFRPWLLQVTRNFCLMQLRGKVRLVNFEFVSNTDMESENGVHQKAQQELVYEQLEEAVRELNTEQRTCIDLFYIRQKTYSDIASITGYSMQEVKSHLQNGRRNLKIKMIEKEGKKI